MLLNRLRNHEILPHFARLRPTEVAFVDLRLIQKCLATDPDSLTAENLERLLYGTAEAPVFSGWGTERLHTVCRQTGLEVVALSQEHKFTTRAKLRAAASSTIKLASERRSQQLWAFRKFLRLKARDALGRTRATLRGGNSAVLKTIAASGKALRLNLGAGEETFPDFVRVDWGGTQDVYDDITRLRAVPDSAAAEIYTNHVLEHIPDPLLQPMLRRWREVLRPGGIIRVRAPDARACIVALDQPWVEATSDEITALGFPNYLYRETVFEGRLDETSAIQAIYGWSPSTPFSWDMSNQHKSLWVPELAKQRFEHAGFEVDTSRNLGTLQLALVARKN